MIESFYYRHVLEIDDLLVITRYELPADGVAGGSDWDDYTPNDAFIDLDSESGVLVQITQPPSIGPGLVGHYLNATELTASAIDFDDPLEDEPTVFLYSSPILFTPNVSEGPATITSDTGANITNTRANLEARIVELVQSIETENPEATGGTNPFAFVPRELVENERLTDSGDDFAINAFSSLPLIIPGAFENSSSLLGDSFGTSFISALTSNAAAAQADVIVDNSSIFSTGLTVVIRDDASQETLEIQSIDADTDTLTMTTNLVNTYTIAANAVVVVTGLLSDLEPQSGERGTNSAFEGFATSLGFPDWAGGMMFVAAFGIALLIATGIASGSYILGSAAIPMVMLAAALAGWIPLTAVFMVAIIVVILATLWIVRLIPS